MPQMMPLLWIYFFILIMTLLFTISFNFFSCSIKLSSYHAPYNSKIWKW